MQSGVTNYVQSQIILNSPLELRGDESIGIQVANSTLDFTNSVVKLNIGSLGNDIN